MDLLVLMFVTGFAVATLIFWPLLHRANRRLAETGVSESSTTPNGKHALRPAALRNPATPKVIPRRPTSTEDQPTPSESKAESEVQAEPEQVEPEEQVESVRVAPQQRSAEPIEMPVLPTDLFEKHFEAKFNRSRQRLAKLRSEINKN
ncbi:hypothetical protein [Saccharopolyspora sp. 5N708]|uniref:hypothetical protein n=1 Tax=Saccharopolyspora sp. 5N708 TaxID=3457424 RepID=UPI003FD6A585